jgi:hypothetical protein
LPKTTLALAVLALQQVASPLFPTKYLPSPGDLETLGNGFPCFCFSRDSWHGTGKLGMPTFLARQKWTIFGDPDFDFRFNQNPCLAMAASSARIAEKLPHGRFWKSGAA